jgi:hypothetical protein
MDWLEFSIVCTQHGGLHDRAIGKGFEKEFRYKLREIMPRIPSTTARAMLPRFEATLAARPPWAESLEEEKWVSLKYLVDELSQPGLRPSLLELRHVFEPGFSRQIYFHYLFLRKRTVIDEYLRVIDTHLADAKKPYIHRKRPSHTTEYVISIMAKACENQRFGDLYNQTLSSQMLCELALHTYHARHHAYPSSLKALVPQYLSKLPDDPFAASGTFGYTRIKRGYRLYSIGPDGIDDGGKASVDGQHRTVSGHNSTYFKKESIGDIVAGVNTQ